MSTKIKFRLLSEQSILFLLAIAFAFSLVSCCDVFKIGCIEGPDSPSTPKPPGPHPDFWVSGCYYIFNDTSDPVNVINGEDKSRKLPRIKQKSISNFDGVYFPWCNNSSEIVNKALRFYSDNNSGNSKLMFYLFQNYSDNKIYYSRDGQWNNIKPCASTEEGRFNVLISCKGTPSVSPIK